MKEDRVAKSLKMVRTKSLSLKNQLKKCVKKCARSKCPDRFEPLEEDEYNRGQVTNPLIEGKYNIGQVTNPLTEGDEIQHRTGEKSSDWSRRNTT